MGTAGTSGSPSSRGGAASATPAITAASLDVAADAAERLAHGLVSNASTTAATIGVLAYVRLASLPGRATAGLVVAWLVFQAAALALRRFGPRHRLYVALVSLEDFVQPAAILGVVHATEGAATFLWLLIFAKAFVWHPRARPRLAFALGGLVAALGGLALAFLASGQPADAAFAGLVACAVVISHSSSARTVLRRAGLRAESDALEARLREDSLRESRDRIARELHDGVGAELTALLLKLRREAREGSRGDDALALAARTQTVLDELRGVVWSLRNEQGTLAELGKLVDATCRQRVGSLAYARTTPAEQTQRKVGPGAALEVLDAARRRIAEVAGEPGDVAIELALSLDDVLVLDVRGRRGDRSVSTAPSTTITLDAPPS